MRIRIFTDGGSYAKPEGSFTAVLSFLIYDGTKMVYGERKAIEDRTNNFAEIKAISLALENAIKYIKATKKTDYTVELYTDSDLCVKSLNTWIYTWMKTAKNGVFYNSNKQEVANQKTIKEAFVHVSELKSKLKIFHINSHIPLVHMKATYTKFLKKNGCKLSYEDFLFAVLKNNVCDEFIEITYQEWLALKNKPT